MKEAGIAKSILSISSPGTNLTSSLKANRALTQRTNEVAAALKRRHPSRFGFFASLPFIPSPSFPSSSSSSDPNSHNNDAAITAALEAIEYAFDKLNADGIILLSNTCGLYLGDPRLRPVLEDLDKRAAIVFIHPTTPCCTLPSVGSHESRHEQSSNAGSAVTTVAASANLGGDGGNSVHGAKIDPF